MNYDKIIRYLEYFENGEKIKSAGFVKIEMPDQVCNIQVNVTGLYPVESCNREVRLTGVRSGEPIEGVLGEIVLQAGKGSLIKRRVPADRLCEGIGYYDLTALRINLGKNRELLCRWKEEEIREQAEEALPQPEPAGIIELEPQPEPAGTIESEMQPAEPVLQEPELQRLPESLIDPEPQEPVTPELLQAEAAQPEPERPVASPSVPSPLHEKKWRQLSEIYPHIAPFRDERDYLSIGPGDFVILPEKYYRLISNSFLLHGYYNYGHMILARSMKRGEEVYYVGVPGNFYEKERQVAIMFGFESFECRQEPARDGDFGYFMIRVEL